MDQVPVLSLADCPWACEKRLEAQELKCTSTAILYSLEPEADVSPPVSEREREREGERDIICP